MTPQPAIYTSVVQEPLRFRAVRMSRWVSQRLPERGALGATVHSVFRRGTNLRVHSGDLLSVCGPEVALAPNGIAIELPAGGTLDGIGIRRGQPATLTAVALRIGEIGFEVGFAGAVEWEPRPHVPAVSRHALARRAHAARRVVIAEGAADSLAPLLRQRGNDGGAGADRLVGAARPAAARLCWGAARHDARAVAESAARLAGLGPGLTPSGDDLLAGFAAGWRLAGEAIGLPDGRLARVLVGLLAGASGRTSELGAAWLAHGARGELAEPMGAFVEALVAADPRGLAAAARRVLALGATSGTDWLVGALLGSEAALAVAARERA